MDTKLNLSSELQSPKIRVLIVEDSPVELKVIEKILQSEPDIQIVGKAMNGLEALNLLSELRPDVICTDYHMPIMDGLEFIEKAVQIYPCPILVLSISVQPDETQTIFKMLTAGAIDVLAKPTLHGGGINSIDGRKLIEKIRILNGVKLLKKTNTRVTQIPESSFITYFPEIVAIGASTGGPQAFAAILPKLPRDFPIPIICVQHISAGFLDSMVNWLNAISSIKVVIAQDGQIPTSGCVYFAPDGYNLKMDRKLGALRFLRSEATDIYCPSINQLFLSLAENSGGNVIGVLLSGMGDDGVAGLKAIFNLGGLTIVQDQASSVIFGMPKEAIAAGVAKMILPAQEIANFLTLHVSKMHNNNLKK